MDEDRGRQELNKTERANHGWVMLLDQDLKTWLKVPSVWLLWITFTCLAKRKLS